MSDDTYLTRRGYAIRKTQKNEKIIDTLKKELLVTPRVNPDMVGADGIPTFPVYRESASKFYIPRCYGLQKFGSPSKDKLEQGEEAPNLIFQGSLRPEQEAPVNAFMEAANDPLRKGGILALPCGFGKCLGKDTPVMMVDGSIKLVQDITMGDQLMGDDSTPRNVLSICRGRENLYRVVPKSPCSDSYIVNKSHILSLKTENGCIIDMQVENYIEHHERGCAPELFGYQVPLKLDHEEIHIRLSIIKSYVQDHVSTVVDGWVTIDIMKKTDFKNSVDASTILRIAREIGCSAYLKSPYLNILLRDGCSLLTKIHLEPMGDGDYYGFEIDGNHRFLLGDFTVTHNTSIALYIASQLHKKTLVVCHKEFLMNQWKERIAQFLPTAKVGMIKQSKVDTEGKDIVLASLQSLAMRDYPDSVFKPFHTVIYDECFPHRTGILTDQGPMHIGRLYSMWKDGNGQSLPLVMSFEETTKTFQWKAITYAWKKETEKPLMRFRYGASASTFSCTSNHMLLSTQGWRSALRVQEGDHLIGYSINKYDPTDIGTKACALMRIKSKRAYFPSKKEVYDLEIDGNHNFVVCNEEGSVGIVAHNCHHLGAEVFSRALMKASAQVILGLSATVTRKDGMSKVFEWHIGKPVYKVKRREESQVDVEIMSFYDPHPDYGRELHLYQKRLNIPAMITNVTNFGKRNMVIIDVMKRYLALNPSRRFLVLSDRRQHLNELARLCKEHDIGPTGFYVGGMKEHALNEAATMPVMLATNMMAAEGLDVPELDTLIFASPCTSIEQPVGRILRKKAHERTNIPTVIDIVDNFSIFARMGKKRHDFYKKNGYVISGSPWGNGPDSDDSDGECDKKKRLSFREEID